jgi:hypothetical protein
LLNNLITERQFLPSAAKLTNVFPCRNIYKKLIAFHITWNGREKLENDEEALKDKEYNSIL